MFTMHPAHQLLTEIKVIKKNDQLRTIRTNLKLPSKFQNLAFRGRVNQKPQQGVVSLLMIEEQNPENAKNPIDSQTRNKKFKRKVSQHETSPKRQTLKTLPALKINSSSPKLRNQEKIDESPLKQSKTQISKNILVPRRNSKRVKIINTSRDCSSQSEKSIIWNDTYLDVLMESQFQNELTQQDKFLLLYKYRYEKEHKKFIQQEELEKQIQQFGFKLQNQEKQIFKQNYVYPVDIWSGTNFKQFYQMNIQCNKRNRFFPNIIVNEKNHG